MEIIHYTLEFITDSFDDYNFTLFLTQTTNETIKHFKIKYYVINLV